MVILDDECGFYDALARVLANPNAMHVRELEAIEGREQDFARVVTDSLEHMNVVAGAVHEDAALVCGIANGIHRVPVWMSTTHGAERYPRWLLSTARRKLAIFEEHIGRGMVLWQAIPTFYTRGIHFVEHLGFRQVRAVVSPRTLQELILVEKES